MRDACGPIDAIRSLQVLATNTLLAGNGADSVQTALSIIHAAEPDTKSVAMRHHGRFGTKGDLALLDAHGDCWQTGRELRGCAIKHLRSCIFAGIPTGPRSLTRYLRYRVDKVSRSRLEIFSIHRPEVPDRQTEIVGCGLRDGLLIVRDRPTACATIHQ